MKNIVLILNHQKKILALLKKQKVIVDPYKFGFSFQNYPDNAKSVFTNLYFHTYFPFSKILDKKAEQRFQLFNEIGLEYTQISNGILIPIDELDIEKLTSLAYKIVVEFHDYFTPQSTNDKTLIEKWGSRNLFMLDDNIKEKIKKSLKFKSIEKNIIYTKLPREKIMSGLGQIIVDQYVDDNLKNSVKACLNDIFLHGKKKQITSLITILESI